MSEFARGGSGAENPEETAQELENDSPTLVESPSSVEFAEGTASPAKRSTVKRVSEPYENQAEEGAARHETIVEPAQGSSVADNRLARGRSDDSNSLPSAPVKSNILGAIPLDNPTTTNLSAEQPKHATNDDSFKKRSQDENLFQHSSDISKPKLSWRVPLYSPRSTPPLDDTEEGGGSEGEGEQVADDGHQTATARRKPRMLKKSLSSLTSLRNFASRSAEDSSRSGELPTTLENDGETARMVRDESENEESAEEIAARKLQQRLKQAKKLENFFIKTDVPPRPALVRTKNQSRDWKFDANNDWLDRCSNPNFCTMKRPFFASFHLAWISFFFCFMGWFAIGPLVPLLLKSGFSKQTIETSNALALASTIIIRFMLGPLCESYGPRLVMTATLAIGGILVCATAGVTDAAGLMAARFFIGLIGGAFVPCQFWISMMFSTKIVGFMSGSAAGFGNSGAGVIVFVMGGLISAFQNAGYSNDQTWRYCLLIPGFMMIACAIPTFFIPADCPQGKWKDKKYGTPADKIGRMAWLHRGGSAQMQRVLKLEQRIGKARWSCWRAMLRVRMFFLTEEKFSAFWDWRAWMVGIQYSVASGVELSILTGLTAYYNFEFGCDGDADRQLDQKAMLLNGTINSTTTCLALDNTAAAYIAAIFGMTNLYGRMVGGGFSDFVANTNGFFHGVRGRHLVIFITLLLQGVFMLIWCSFTDWAASAGFLILFSSIVHLAKGAVIAIAPFVSPGCVGPVMGVVSAVGNLGGVLMSLMYSGFKTSREVYYWQGWICVVGSLSAFTLKVHDLELNRDVWLLSRPPKREDFEFDGDDEVRRRNARSLTSKLFSIRRRGARGTPSMAGTDVPPTIEEDDEGKEVQAADQILPEEEKSFAFSPNGRDPEQEDDLYADDGDGPFPPEEQTTAVIRPIGAVGSSKSSLALV